MDEPSAQLLLDLRASIQSSLSARRPLLHHLNADTSWLLQVPRPESAVRHGARFYFNILIDPWLAGGQSDVAKWFSQQFHATPSAVGSIAEVEELARELEILASGLRLGYGRRSNAADAEGLGDSLIDAVAISHEFTDHCHKDTLLEVHADVPVFATEKAASLIRGWKHFRFVQETPVFGQGHDRDWQSTSIPPLPDWIGIARLLSTQDVLNYHSALMITFNTSAGTPPLPKVNGDQANDRRKRKAAAMKTDEDEDAAEAVIYTPHGINNSDLTLIASASPPIRTLAFLHGLHGISIGSQQQLNLGGHNGLKAQRILNAKYWIGTHDEVKKGGGLVSWFLRRNVISLKDALAQEKCKLADEKWINGESKEALDAFEDTRWLELDNGESRILS